ncbi:MAG TPA: DUF3501 family protein [Acidimicrobiales bacterium]|nr:DUF3501 family protein [Acidimicrobiales bacterium]
MNRPLVVDDIEDLRSYERGRDEYRRRIIELKRRRRVAVGPIVTLVFENRETVRFQVQEMARAERMVTDEQVQGELDVYNALLPTAGELSATMFIELTDEAALREWLPKLVGVERSLELRIGSGADGSPDDAAVAPGVPEATHEQALTRPTMTASVHYVRFGVTPEQATRFAEGPVVVAVVHPDYRHETVLSDETRAELLTDLQG